MDDQDETNQIIEALLGAGTAVVADVFDNLGLEPPVLDNELWPTRGPGSAFAGPAYTISGVSQAGRWSGDRDKLGAIDAMSPGLVAVYAGNDIRGVCCFGDLLASAMRCRGVSGVIVDGGVRDLAFLRELELPMLVRYRTPAQAIGRWKVDAVQQPVRLRGALTDLVTVEPGDIVVADDDGAVIVPRARAAEIAELAAAWESKDQAAREDIVGGMKLLDALEKHGAL